ncbi:MAG: AI-2E family transporter [Allorhizobium sp.]
MMMTERTTQAGILNLNSEAGRRRVSVCIVFLAILLLLALLPATLLMIFAGLLLAILPRSSGAALARKMHIKPVWGVALVIVATVGAIAVIATALAPSVSDQIDELWRQIPSSINAIRTRIEQYAWGKSLIERIQETDLWALTSRGEATSAVTSVFGYIGNSIILVFIALYAAFDPDTYRRGFLALFAPSIRPRADEVLSRSVNTLHQWLIAKLIAMSVVGVLTFVGLWFVDVPLALVLGLIAGLLAFIPNLGPVLAAAPGLLLALPQGLHTVLLVLGVYLLVQTLESYVITPVIQQQKVALPPLLVISAQLLFGSMFGLIGLALATPLTALAIQLTSDLYVKTYLEQSQPTGGNQARRNS